MDDSDNKLLSKSIESILLKNPLKCYSTKHIYQEIIKESNGNIQFKEYNVNEYLEKLNKNNIVKCLYHSTKSKNKLWKYNILDLSDSSDLSDISNNEQDIEKNYSDLPELSSYESRCLKIRPYYF